MTLYGNSIAQAAEHWLHFSREADIIFTRKSSPHSESYYGRFHLICTIAKRLTAVSIATVPRHSLVYSTPARRTNTSRLVRSRRGLTSYPVRVYTRRVEPTTSLLRHRRTSSFADKHTHTCTAAIDNDNSTTSIPGTHNYEVRERVSASVGDRLYI